MKSFTTSKTTPYLLAGAFMAGAVALPTYAADCKAPKDFIEKKACDKAKQGPDALRRFVERTRMIYGLYYWDYAPQGNEPRVAVAQGDSTVAPAK
jgi:hypothetical protein